MGVLCLSLFCYALLSVYFSFAVILKMKRKLVALLFLSYRCIVTINVLWLFPMMQRVGLLYMIVVCPDNTHVLFDLAVLFFSFYSGQAEHKLWTQEHLRWSIPAYSIFREGVDRTVT